MWQNTQPFVIKSLSTLCFKDTVLSSVIFSIVSKRNDSSQSVGGRSGHYIEMPRLITAPNILSQKVGNVSVITVLLPSVYLQYAWYSTKYDCPCAILGGIMGNRVKLHAF